MATPVSTVGLRILVTLTVAAIAAMWWPGAAVRVSSDDAAHDVVDPERADATAGRHLAWIDRAGRTTAMAAPPRGYAYPRLSPDGALIAIDIRDAQHGLWLWDVARATLSPLSAGRARDVSPVWSRSGQWLLFARGRGVPPALVRVDVGPGDGRPAASGGGERRLPGDSNSLLMPSSLTPDDRHALVTSSTASGFDVLAIDLQGDGEPVPVVTTAADDLNGELSPDGQWLAYQSRASGQFEIWVKRWGADGAGLQVTTAGGTRPAWTRGGGELVYLTHDGDMMALSVLAENRGGEAVGDPTGTGRLHVGVPQRLFTAGIYRDLVGRTFDVTPDGERFLVVIGL